MRPFGHKICVNLLISERALAWHQHDLYSAREICQMIPISGVEVYHRFCAANAWTESILPNSGRSTSDRVPVSAPVRKNTVQKLLEISLGIERLEQWAMKFQLARITHKWGSGDETRFSVDVCQSNFHNHRKSTQELFKKRLAGIESLLRLADG